MQKTSFRRIGLVTYVLGFTLVVAPAAHAQTMESIRFDPPRASSLLSAQLALPHDSVDATTWRWSNRDAGLLAPSSRVGISQAPRGMKRSRAYRSAQRITAAVALGVAGFFAGGVAGAGLGSIGRSGDAVLQGFAIGAPTGAIAGAALGLVMVR